MCDEARHRLSMKADRDRSIIFSMMAGAGIVLVVLGGTGLAIALSTGGALGDSRAAYSASLLAMSLAGSMVLAVGGLFVIMLVHRLIRRELSHINARMDEHANAFRALVDATGDEVGARRNGDGPPAAQARFMRALGDAASDGVASHRTNVDRKATHP